MTRIAVSANLLVDFDADRWRLVELGTDSLPNLLLEAKAGGLRYAEAWGNARALPATGEIQARDIHALSLEWSPQAAAWRLSLAWSPELSITGERREFIVLDYALPPGDAAADNARQLAQSLADALGIAIGEEEIVEPPPEPVTLIDLPLQLGIWQLRDEAGAAGKRGERALRLIRAEAWRRAKLRQTAWYAVLTLVYAFVSLATLGNDLALPNAGTLIPNPSLLPYLGLGVAVLLLLLILRGIWQLNREPDSIVISGDEGSVSAYRGARLRWSLDAAAAQSVFASELVKKRDRQPTVYHAEINLQLANGKFRRLIIDPTKRKAPLLPGVDVEAEKARQPGVEPLVVDNMTTALQAAALHISHCLGDLPAWRDRRHK